MLLHKRTIIKKRLIGIGHNNYKVMPRGICKEKNQLISGKGCYAFLTERLDTKKKLGICNQLLDSLLKTRTNNKERRDTYITNIRNCFKTLCIQSTDLLEEKRKHEETKQDLSRESRKRAELRDKLTEAEIQNSKYSEYKARFEEQKLCTYRSEQDYGELLRENDILKETIENLKEQNKILKKQAKVSKAKSGVQN